MAVILKIFESFTKRMVCWQNRARFNGLNLGNYMKKLLAITSLSIILSSCITAPSNGRSSSTDGNGPRAGSSDCTTSGTIQCATTHSALGFSMVYRDLGVDQLTFDQIQSLLAKEEAPKTYHFVSTEKVGYESSVLKAELSGNLDNCGEEPHLNGVKARYTDCDTTWKGGTNGISGEGDWKLVMRDLSRDAATLWLDTRTNLIWSHKITDAVWANANGSAEVIDDRVCHSLEELTTDENGISHISWRLPNRNEFLQADINGSRFVLQTENEEDNASEYFWTASQVDENHAWTIQNNTGILKQESKTNIAQVRCVGVILK